MRPKRNRASKAVLCAVLLAAALAAGPADAQNLVGNGGFASGTGSWNGLDAGALQYSASIDADDSPDSGSALLRNTSPGASNTVVFAQCLAGFVPGAEHYLRSRVRLTAGETRTGFVRTFAQFHAQPGCLGSFLTQLAGTSHPTTDGRGIWFDSNIGSIAGGVAASPNAKSVLVYVVLYKKEAGGTLSANVDRLFFAPVGIPTCHGLAPTLGGSDGPDVIRGTPGPDVIVGMSGDDVINGRGGADTICGGPGDDVLKGGRGADLLDGGTGDDVLRGGPRNDHLVGGPGFDDCGGGTGAADVDLGSCEVVSGVP